MTLRKLEDLADTALRDHGTRDRVDRVWRRLSADIQSAAPRRRATLWWAPAAAAIVFGSGVVVGAKWARPEAPPAVSAEPPSLSEPAQPSSAPATAAEERRPERTRSEPQRSAPRATVARPAPPTFGFEEEPALPPVFAESPAPAGPPEWKLLADAGDFEAAARSLDRVGGFHAVLGGANSAQLMSLVDIARATGGRDRAVLALRRVLDAYPDTPEAPLAAWTLGNVLEQSGDEAGAAEAFALYRRLSPSGDFAEDAVVREVDAALVRGNLELAAGLIEQYAKDYPHGRRLDEFRRELEELRAADAGAAQPVAPPPTGQVKGIPATP